MVIRKALLMICLLLLPLSAAAKQEKQTYVIKKGDTLWGISERFVKDPYYWPNLWANNPYLTNPHFIYPGQKLEIYDGRIEIVPVHPEAPMAPVATDGKPPVDVGGTALPEPQEEITIRTLAGGEGFVTDEELAVDGTLVDTVDNRILMAEGDQVFAEMGNLAATSPGDVFLLYDIGDEVTHPRTEEPIGHQVIPLGTMTVTQINSETVTGVITSSLQEIQRGARLRPYEPAQREVTMKKADRDLAGLILGAKGGQITLGQNDIIYVDLGAEDGLREGNLLYLTRPREATALALREDIELPDVLLGAAVVLQTRPNTASALVLKSAGPLYRGDRALTMVD